MAISGINSWVYVVLAGWKIYVLLVIYQSDSKSKRKVLNKLIYNHLIKVGFCLKLFCVVFCVFMQHTVRVNMLSTLIWL